MPTEADTCRKFVVPKLQAAGWDNDPHSIAEQRTITDGRVVPVGEARGQHPDLAADNEPDLFLQFGTQIGGLTRRQAEAMYWKDWFWTVREGHIRYEDEPAHL
jgi:hypothetical protein